MINRNVFKKVLSLLDNLNLSSMEITKQFLYDEWVTNRKTQREISDELGIKLGKLEPYFKKFGLNRVRSKEKYDTNEEHINLSSEIFWYLAGLIISDGYIDTKNNRVSISLKNKDILEQLSYYFSGNRKIPIRKYQYGKRNVQNPRYSLIIVSKKLIKTLEEIGIHGKNKTSTVIMPDPKSKELFNFLFRGFLDGDGNIRYNKTALNITFRYYAHSINLVNTSVELYRKYYNVDLVVSNVKGRLGKVVSSKINSTLNLISIYEKLPNLCIKEKRDVIKNLVDDIVHLYGMINHRKW